MLSSYVDFDWYDNFTDIYNNIFNTRYKRIL